MACCPECEEAAKPPRKYKQIIVPEGYFGFDTGDDKVGLVLEDAVTKKIIWEPDYEEVSEVGGSCLGTTGVTWAQSVSMRPTLPAGEYLYFLESFVSIPAKANPALGNIWYWPGMAKGAILAQPVAISGTGSNLAIAADYYNGNTKQTLRAPGTNVAFGTSLRGQVIQALQADGRYLATISWVNRCTLRVYATATNKLDTAYAALREYQGASSHCGNFGPNIAWSGIKLQTNKAHYPSGWRVGPGLPSLCKPITAITATNPGGSVYFSYQNRVAC